MNDLFLRALKCEAVERPPVWLMRQAGRYMPQYQALRKNHTLSEMFHNPSLAAQVTRLPLDLLGVDAAILFSDILVISESLGLSVVFPEKGGPRIEPCIATADQIDALKFIPVEKSLSYVFETIEQLKPSLNVPLIGFCGGPFTVASYFVDPINHQEFTQTKMWMEKDPAAFHQLLEKITQASIAYLQAQIRSGVNVVQIFDSWLSILTDEQRRDFALPYLKKMVDALKGSDIPVILFCRHSSLFPLELAEINPHCISFDWLQPMKTLRQVVPSHIAIQGNVDPTFLKKSPEEIIAFVKNLNSSMRGEKGFIVNLGHGVLPDIPFENVRHFVDAVKSTT